MFNGLFNPTNYSFNPYTIPNIAVGLYCVVLAIFAILKSKSLQGFGLGTFTISSGIWLFGFGLMYLSNNPDTAFLWNKISHFLGGVCFISVGSFFFVLTVTEKVKIKKEKIILFSGCFIMAVFAFLIASTDLVIKYPPRKFFWGYYTNVGILHNVFLPLWLAYVLRATWFVYQAYKKEENALEKSRLKIYLSAYLYGYIAAGDYLAAYGLGIYPFGYIFIGTYLTFLTYNIIKYRALEIETVIHKTLLWLITILVVVLPAGVIGFLVFKKFFPLLHPLWNIFLFSLALVCFSYYYFYLRPKIDRLFGKKEYASYEILGRIAKEVSTTLDIQEFAARLLNELYSSVYPKKILLWLRDEKEQAFTIFTQNDFQQNKEEFISNLSLPLNDTLSQYLIDTNEILEVQSVSINPDLKYLQKSDYFPILQENEIELLIPLRMENNVVGILGLGKKQSLRLYTLKDLEIFNSLGSELGPLIYNNLHHKDIIEQERLKQEMELGRDIQLNLLPREAPQVEGLKLAGLMIPAKEIGGDYYDYIVSQAQITNDKAQNNDQDQSSRRINKLAIVIGDVSGKGVAAGLIMATAKATLKGLSEQELSPRQMLTKANSLLHEYTKGEKFMTMLYLRWDNQHKKLNYSSAGHEHIIIYRHGDKLLAGSSMLNAESKSEKQEATDLQPSASSLQQSSVEVIQSGGFMLGMLPAIGEMLEDCSLQLNSGDKVILYTDGVTEARNPAEELYSLERLTDSVQRHGYKPVEELLTMVRQEVYGFISTQEQYDDITLVVLEAE